jgi:DNA polymerase-1
MSVKPIVLVDGSSYLYRAVHALPALTTADGRPTGAVLGVVNMLYRLLDEYDPERMAVVFDAPGKTFRDDLYAEYKAHRPPMPDELRAQLTPLLDVIAAMGIPLLRVVGVEADDVIGTLAQEAADASADTVISTGDKDLAQLVGPHVTLVNTMDATTLDRAGVERKFGVPPEKIVDYLALVGDSSDNIPGVPGVGPKTAAKWLNQYGSLDEIKARAGEVPGKIGERLREALPLLDVSKALATIRCDCELPTHADGLALRRPDAARLRELFASLEFVRLLRRADEAERAAGFAATSTGATGATPPASATATATPSDATTASGPATLSGTTTASGIATAAREAPPPAPSAVRYETITTLDALDALVARIANADLVALDTETTSLNYMRAELVGLSIAWAPGEAVYIPLSHRYPGAPDQLDAGTVLERLRPWFESAAPKVGHHAKFDMHILENHGVRIACEYDTMLESYVLNSTATRHDMDSLAAKYLGVTTVKYEEVVGKGARQITFDQVDLDTATRYAAEDADVTLRLHAALWPRLVANPELARVYEDIERPLVRVLEKMEHTGVLVDAAMLKRQSAELATTMARTEAAAYEAAGGPFNLGSPKQLQEVLYERLALPILGKTPKGQPSTAEDVLQELAASFDLPRLVLEYRALAKLKSTYTDKLPLEIEPRTGRIHTSYHQAVAATGRLSSSDPNLQNIPIRTPEGRRIRQAFVAPPGYVLLAADYSQIELRIMAHLSGDLGLLEAFANDQDIHRTTASEVFNTPVEEVTADQRRSAKAINFGLIYGMSAFGLAKQLGIERGEAQTYVNLYFERYPGVKRYMDETRRIAREQGYVTTVFGRRLHLPEINSRNGQRRQYAERAAINAPMQGTAADIIKRAMLTVDAWLTDGRVPGRLIMQVHVELVVEVAGDAAGTAAEEVKALMEGAAALRVPLRVDTGVGANWDEAH